MRLGIDFGTCYSSAALLFNGTAIPIKEPLTHRYSFPSSIFVTEKGETLVGQAAENSRQKAPHRYRREFKRDLGTLDPYTLGNFTLLPEELVIKILCKLKSEADKIIEGRREEAITEVVLTVPATYSAYKKKLMEESALKAGFSLVNLLEEPVAAAVYYSHHANVKPGETILVYDLGGGTFDATLIQKQDSGYQLLGIPKGLPHCGGIDFDRQIYQHLKSQCSVELRQQLETKEAWLARAIVSDLCRDIKHQLSEEQNSTIYIPLGLGKVESFSLTRSDFNTMITPLLHETIDCCDQLVRSVQIDWTGVNHLLLVGGSCRIPYVKEILEQRLQIPCVLVDEPELAVCWGAAIHEIKHPIKPDNDTPVEIPTPEDTSTPKPSQQDLAQLYYKQGLDRSQEKAHYQAIENFNQALQIKPDYSEVYYARALVRNVLGDSQGAIEDLRQAANHFLNQNNLAGYQKALDKIKELNQSSISTEKKLTPEELYQEGLNSIKQGTYQDAIKQFGQILETQPGHTNAYFRRGFAYFCLGAYQKAIDDCTQAIQINSNYADAYVARGFAHYGIGNIKEALKDFNHVTHNYNNHGVAFFGRSLMRALVRDHQGAIADLKRLRSLDSNYDTAEHNRALSYIVQGRKSEVLGYLEKALNHFFN